MLRGLQRVGSSASLERLEKLLAERLGPGADKSAIDARIWDMFGEEWAVMFTDLSGFSRQVAEFGIIHFLQVIYEAERIFCPSIDRYDGILLKIEGDSMLIIFRSARKAVECAIAMQQAGKVYNADKADTEKILLCVGLGFGKMLRLGDQDVFGAEVNAASKLGEDTAKAWDILATGALVQAAGNLDGVTADKLPDAPPGADSAYRLRYPL